MTFYHPIDGYLYGWRWSTGEEEWWSTSDLALRHPRDIAGQPGEPIRRRYVVGEVEPWNAAVERVCLDVLNQGGHVEDCVREDCRATDGQCCAHCTWVPA